MTLRIELVRLMPAALTRTERGWNLRLLSRHPKRLFAGMPVHHGKQNLSARECVLIVSDQDVILCFGLRHALRHKQALQGAVCFEDRLRAVAPVLARSSLDFPGLLVHSLIINGNAKCGLV